MDIKELKEGDRVFIIHGVGYAEEISEICFDEFYFIKATREYGDIDVTRVNSDADTRRLYVRDCIIERTKEEVIKKLHEWVDSL